MNGHTIPPKFKAYHVRRYFATANLREFWTEGERWRRKQSLSEDDEVFSMVEAAMCHI